MKYSLIYITANSNNAKEIARNLVENKLVACVNMVESNSCYNWEGKVNFEKETILICKTLKEKVNLVEDKVKEIHEYEIPCVLSVDFEGNNEFLKWLANSVSLNYK